VQNFADIGQSVNELWRMAKKAIFKMATVAILNLKKKLIFGHVTAIGLHLL